MNSQSDQNKHFSFPYSLDPEDFFRLECPSCGRHFKVRAEAISMTDILTPAFRQIERESGISLTASVLSEGESEIKADHLTCPYCGHADEPSNMNTQEFIDHAVRWLQREYVHDLVDKFSRDLRDTFRGSSKGRNKGFISVEWDYQYHPSPKPTRPISGPELPDMSCVEVLCCGKTIKITDGWGANIFCPYCSQELVLQ